MHTIETKYRGPSSNFQARIIATGSMDMSVSVPYNDALSSRDNHIAAAKALLRKFNKDMMERQGHESTMTIATWISGETKTGMIHVQADDHKWTLHE